MKPRIGNYIPLSAQIVNTPPAKWEALGSPLEKGEDDQHDHLKPKFEFRIFHDFTVFN
jgi:hypothetical protein